MARYIARFMKDVLGANGHETEICQRSIEIEAPSRGRAAELAKKEFCETENVRDRSRRTSGSPVLVGPKDERPFPHWCGVDHR